MHHVVVEGEVVRLVKAHVFTVEVVDNGVGFKFGDRLLVLVDVQRFHHFFPDPRWLTRILRR